ncbi:hypothetical protein ACJZ2D_015373 [Fusarium nematophilum]
MFRRKWSGLPEDASFASDLAGLGYFVNDEDEIRSIENPDCYFKFFTSKNLRVNERQRFCFNGAMEKIIHERLEKYGLVRFPLRGGPPHSEKHSPIFMTPFVRTHSRIVVVLGEPTQDLGLLAGRVANGPGGLVQGSMISVVEALKGQTGRPGIVLANMGQRHWWPEEGRALTVSGSADIPLPSLVALNFFDQTYNWRKWGVRLSAMLLMGTVYNTENLANKEFKDFLAKRTRGYLVSPDPLGTPLATPRGNPALGIEPLGCPCFSAGEPYFTELLTVRALRPALAYLEEVASTRDFENPPIAVAERLPTDFTDEDWNNLADENKPEVTTQNAEELKKQLKEMRRWKKFEETGEAPEWDSDECDEAEEVPRNMGKADWREGEDW